MTTPNYEATTETISPERAEELLKLNTHNRPLNEWLVNRYAATMAAGSWKNNADTIRISSSNKLLDGQHRLAAIVKSQTNQTLLVIRGVDESVFDTLDIGRRRAISDVLHCEGEVNTVTLGAALGNLYKYIQGRLLNPGGAKTDYETLTNLLVSFPQLRDSVSFVRNGGMKLIPPSLLSTLHMLMAMKDKPLADAFVSGMEKGFDMTTYPNFFLLREIFMRNALSKSKYAPGHLAALAIKAWNATRSGQVVKRLTFQEDETYPQVS